MNLLKITSPYNFPTFWQLWGKMIKSRKTIGKDSERTDQGHEIGREWGEILREKVVLFGSNKARMDRCKNGGVEPRDTFRAAQIQGISRRYFFSKPVNFLLKVRRTIDASLIVSAGILSSMHLLHGTCWLSTAWTVSSMVRDQILIRTRISLGVFLYLLKIIHFGCNSRF